LLTKTLLLVRKTNAKAAEYGVTAKAEAKFEDPTAIRS